MERQSNEGGDKISLINYWSSLPKRGLLVPSPPCPGPLSLKGDYWSPLPTALKGQPHSCLTTSFLKKFEGFEEKREEILYGTLILPLHVSCCERNSESDYPLIDFNPQAVE